MTSFPEVCPSLRALSIMPCGKLKRSPGYEMSWHWRRVHIVVVCRSIVILSFLFIYLFFLRYNSSFNRNCSSLSHTFPNHQRLVQSKVNLLEYKNRLCRHETGDRLFQLTFFFFWLSWATSSKSFHSAIVVLSCL